MCAQCCLCLCIVYYWLSLFPVCPMLYVCLYCPLLIVTLSCAPNVFCVSVLSIMDCHCFMCAQCCMCLCIGYYWLSLFSVCPMLSVSLYSLLWIVTVYCVPNVVCVSVFSRAHMKQWQSIIDNTETQKTLGAQETVTINNRQYRHTYNIGHTGNSDNQ
jgi:hypothetical protein